MTQGQYHPDFSLRCRWNPPDFVSKPHHYHWLVPLVSFVRSCSKNKEPILGHPSHFLCALLRSSQTYLGPVQVASEIISSQVPRATSRTFFWNCSSFLNTSDGPHFVAPRWISSHASQKAAFWSWGDIGRASRRECAFLQFPRTEFLSHHPTQWSLSVKNGTGYMFRNVQRMPWGHCGRWNSTLYIQQLSDLALPTCVPCTNSISPMQDNTCFLISTTLQCGPSCITPKKSTVL